MRVERIIAIRSRSEAVGSYRPLLMLHVTPRTVRNKETSEPGLIGRRIAMDPRYRTSTTSCLIVYSTTAALAFCAAIASCNAANRSNSFVESGQPRDLVNRPDCWTREHSDDWYRCAAGLR